MKIAIPSIQPSAMPSLMQPITNDTKAAAHNSLKISSSKQPTILKKNAKYKKNIKMNRSSDKQKEEYLLDYWYVCFCFSYKFP